MSAKKAVAFQEAALLVRHELLRFKLGDRNRTLAILILSLSWDEGIATVRIPKLDIFERLTGLEANHVSETLSELEMQRVVTVTETPGGKLYAVNPDSANWQVTPRKLRTTMLETLNLVREINGVQRLSEDQLNFKVQASATFILEYAGMPVRTSTDGCQRPIHTLVTERQATQFICEADAWLAVLHCNLTPKLCRVVNLSLREMNHQATKTTKP